MITQTPSRNSTTYHDAIVEYRRIGNQELCAEIDALRYQIADIGELYGGDALALFDLTEQLRAAKQELVRRERLYAAGHDVPDPHDSRYGGWADLAQQINERADIVAIFARAGWVLSRAGRNGRRNCEEWAGACLACGGTDRLRVWTAGPAGPGYWCRQCGVSGNAIIAYRNLYGDSFFEACRALAQELGLAIPTPHRSIQKAPARRPQPRTFEYRRGQVVTR